MNKNSISLLPINILVGTLCFLLISCGPKTRPVSGNQTLILTPDLNVSLISELGDTLVDQGHMTTREAIETQSDTEASYVAWNIFLGKGSYVATQYDEKYTYYYPHKAKVSISSWATKDGLAEGITIGFAKSNSDNSLTPFLMDPISGYMMAKFVNNLEPSYKEGSFQEKYSSAFRQQIIYNGKVDNNIKFIYREFSNDMARAPFSQQMQYDLGESKIIGFKGARIEVVKATNTQIDYKVLSHFNR